MASGEADMVCRRVSTGAVLELAPAEDSTVAEQHCGRSQYPSSCLGIGNDELGSYRKISPKGGDNVRKNWGGAESMRELTDATTMDLSVVDATDVWVRHALL